MALVQQAIKILGQAATKADPSSSLGQCLLDAIKKLAKEAPATQSAPGTIEPQALRNLQSQAKSSAPMQALSRQMQASPQAAPPTAGE